MFAETLAPPRPRSRVASEHTVFLFTALLFVATAIVGFAPRSAAILAGAMPNPPLIVHVHAALMSSWLLLLATQAALLASARRDLHMLLGLGSVLLAPAMLIAMVGATFVTYGLMTSAGMGELGSNILLLQLRSLLLFPLFLCWGLLTRHSDPATHKRMMLLATFVLIDAAIARMDWLPGNDIMRGYGVTFLVQFLLLVPVLLFELLRQGRVHGAWLRGLALYLPWVLLTTALWNSPWWHATAQRLFL